MKANSKRGYNLNLPTRTLTITKAFEDEVNSGKGAEYEIYMKFLREIPGLIVERRTHASPTKYKTKSGEEYYCNQFKNLKYENMEGFINGLPDNAEYLRAYNFLKNCGSLVQTARYTAVRKWFVAQFPHFRKNPLFYLYNPVKIVDIAPFIEEEQNRVAELEAKKAAAEKEAQQKNDKAASA